MLSQFYIILEPLGDYIVIEAMLSPEFRIEILHNDSRIDYRILNSRSNLKFLISRTLIIGTEC